MKKLSNKQRSAREKYYENIYLNTLKQLNTLQDAFKKEHKQLIEAQKCIKELKYFQTLTPEEREEIKIAIKKISEFQTSDVGKFMGERLMPVLSIFKRIGPM